MIPTCVTFPEINSKFQCILISNLTEAIHPFERLPTEVLLVVTYHKLQNEAQNDSAIESFVHRFVKNLVFLFCISYMYGKLNKTWIVKSVRSLSVSEYCRWSGSSRFYGLPAQSAHSEGVCSYLLGEEVLLDSREGANLLNTRSPKALAVDEYIDWVQGFQTTTR